MNRFCWKKYYRLANIFLFSISALKNVYFLLLKLLIKCFIFIIRKMKCPNFQNEMYIF